MKELKQNNKLSSSLFLATIQEIGLKELDLSLSEFALYWHFLKFINSPHGCFEENKTIASALNVSERTVRSAKSTLSLCLPLIIEKRFIDNSVTGKRERSSDKVTILPFDDPNSLILAKANYFESNNIKPEDRDYSVFEILDKNFETLGKIYQTLKAKMVPPLRQNLPNPPEKITAPLRQNLPKNDLSFKLPNFNDDDVCSLKKDRSLGNEHSSSSKDIKVLKTETLEPKTEEIQAVNPQNTPPLNENQKEAHPHQNPEIVQSTPSTRFNPNGYEASILDRLRPHFIPGKNFFDWKNISGLDITIPEFEKITQWMFKNDVKFDPDRCNTPDLFKTKINQYLKNIKEDEQQKLQRTDQLKEFTLEEKILRNEKFDKIKSLFR